MTDSKTVIFNEYKNDTCIHFIRHSNMQIDRDRYLRWTDGL